MRTKRLFYISVSLLVLVALLAGCAPAATPVVVEKEKVVEKPVVQTVVVEKEKVVEKKVVETVVVEKEKVVEKVLTPTPAGPKQGGNLVVGMLAEPKGLDPHTVGAGSWRAQMSVVYERPIALNALTLELEPQLCTKWEWVDEGKALLLTIREGVKFHNGEPFTAEDLKWNIDRVRNPDTGSPWRGGYANVTSVEVVGANQVKINLSQGQAGLPFQLTYLWITAKSNEANLEASPIGTGPFKFAEWKKNNYIKFEKFDDYWQEGKPYLDSITFKVISEAETRLSALATGDIDIAYDVPLKDVPRLYGMGDVIVAATKPVDQHFTVHVNSRHAPLDNKLVRQAIAYAVDRETFMREFTAGLGIPSNSPFPPGHWAYNEECDKMYSYDMEKAAQLLAEAGYPNGEGMRELVFAVPAGYPEFVAGSEMMQASLAELGIKSKIEVMDLGIWFTKFQEPYDYDMAWDYPGRGAGDPDFLYQGVIWKPREDSWQGMTPEKLPRYAELIAQAGAMTDQAERKKLYDEICMIVTDYVGELVIGFRPNASGLRAWVKGFVPHPLYVQEYTGVWLDK